MPSGNGTVVETEDSLDHSRELSRDQHRPNTTSIGPIRIRVGIKGYSERLVEGGNRACKDDTAPRGTFPNHVKVAFLGKLSHQREIVVISAVALLVLLVC